MKNPLKPRFPALILVVLAVLVLALGGTAIAGPKCEKKVIVKVADDEGGYLGISMEDLSPHMAKALGLKDDDGVLVEDVVDDSPADEAGLEPGDVVLEFAGAKIKSTDCLFKAVRKTPPGDEMKIVVFRDGKRKDITARIGEKKMAKKEAWTLRVDDDKTCHLRKLTGTKTLSLFTGDRGFMGVHLLDLTEQLGDYFGVEDGEGSLISQVVEDSPAEKAGLKAGDVILEIEDEEIASAGDIHTFMGGTDEGDEIEVKVRRNKKDKTFKLTLAEAPGELAWVDESEHTLCLPEAMMLEKLCKKGKDLHKDVFIQKYRQKHAEELRKELDELRAQLEELKKELQEDDD